MQLEDIQYDLNDIHELLSSVSPISGQYYYDTENGLYVSTNKKGEIVDIGMFVNGKMHGAWYRLHKNKVQYIKTFEYEIETSYQEIAK